MRARREDCKTSAIGGKFNHTGRTIYTWVFPSTKNTDETIISVLCSRRYNAFRINIRRIVLLSRLGSCEAKLRSKDRSSFPLCAMAMIVCGEIGGRVFRTKSFSSKQCIYHRACRSVSVIDVSLGHLLLLFIYLLIKSPMRCWAYP